MIDKQIVSLIDTDNIEKEAEILLYFKLNHDGKDYMIYTFNEKDDNGLVILNTSEVVKEEDGKYSLKKVSDDESWNYIKEVMRRIINSSRDKEE